MKKFEIETLIKAGVVGGTVILVLLVILILDDQPVLTPVVVMTLLGLLVTIVQHYFPRNR